MTEETSIEAQTAAVVAARRARGPNKSKPKPHKPAAKPAKAETPAEWPMEAPAVEEAPATNPVFPITFVEPTLTVNRAPGKRLFPVKLLRNYHPEKPFLIAGREPNDEERVKVFAGTEIEMDVDEAKAVISKGIGERNDPIG